MSDDLNEQQRDQQTDDNASGAADIASALSEGGLHYKRRPRPRSFR